MESRSPVHIKTEQKQHLTILWVNNMELPNTVYQQYIFISYNWNISMCKFVFFEQKNKETKWRMDAFLPSFPPAFLLLSSRNVEFRIHNQSHRGNI